VRYLRETTNILVRFLETEARAYRIELVHFMLM